MNLREFAVVALLAGCGGAKDAPPAVAPLRVCAPGQQVECACPAGAKGAQACKDDGSSYLPCVCPGVMAVADGGSPSDAGFPSADSSNDVAAVIADADNCKHFYYAAYAPQSMPTFTDDIAPLFATSCATSSSCHQNGAHPPDLGPGAISTILGGLIGINSTMVASMKYVVRSEPQNSWLMRKVEDANPGCGLACVPPAGFPAACRQQEPQTPPLLTTAEQATLRDWIASGAY